MDTFKKPKMPKALKPEKKSDVRPEDPRPEVAAKDEAEKSDVGPHVNSVGMHSPDE